MKKIFTIILSLILLCLGLSACANDNGTKKPPNDGIGGNKVLIAYFSATGTTKKNCGKDCLKNRRYVI